MTKNPNGENGVNPDLLKAAIKFNAIVLGCVSGLLAATVIFVATHISLAKWGEYSGQYLNLLGVFLPGYTASESGAWVGAFWGFIFAGLAGFLTYWSYGRLLGRRLGESAGATDETIDPVLKPAILRLFGVPLGLSVGSAVGGALCLTTWWLVARGTAEQSSNAALLANYLPGYSPSIVGGIVGGIELLLIVFVSCQLLVAVYNKVVEIRHGKTV